MIDVTLLQKIYDLPFSSAIRENANAFPFIETLHVIALSLVFGTILIVDLRLVGIAAHRKGVERLIGELLPFTWAGFALAVVTGCLLFMSNAVAYANNIQFLAKLALIALAGLNMIWFHSTTYRRISVWGEDMQPPFAARVSGFLSLTLWTVVIILGRWIGFTLEAVF